MTRAWTLYTDDDLPEGDLLAQSSVVSRVEFRVDDNLVFFHDPRFDLNSAKIQNVEVSLQDNGKTLKIWVNT